jgi:Lipopolysaccharide kinase (Kdo/WaaP) family
LQVPQSDIRSAFKDYDLESLPPLSSISSRPSSYESWVPYDLPSIPSDLKILDWTHLATGTHGSVRKVHVQFDDFDGTICLKLFSEEWKEAYDREVATYALMVHRKVRRCIPHIYWKGAKSLSEWNGEDGDEQGGDEVWYGIGMEYLKDFREVQFERIDLATAEAVARALNRIHEARIMHGDMQERNILLVREGGIVRAVWIDFSCAWINAYGKTLDREWGFLMGEFELKGVKNDDKSS